MAVAAAVAYTPCRVSAVRLSRSDTAMDEFGYLSVLLSIILGLAITQLLKGFRGIVLARSQTVLYLPVVTWAVVLLLIAVQTWWAMFGLRTVRAWTFLQFAVVLFQTILLYMLAALAVLASPLFLRAGNLLQPVALDQLWWTFALLALARLGRAAGAPDGNAGREHTDDAARRDWIALGVAVGLGLLTKFSIAFLGASVLVAILLTSLRRSLATRWPWLALGITLVIGSPSIIGQVALGYPVLGQMHELQSTQLERTTAADFLLGQLLLGPAVALAAAGMVALLGVARFRSFRAVGIAAAGAFVLLLALHGKSYYIGPIYPTLFAAGAVLLEPAMQERRPWRRYAQTGMAALIVLYGVVTLPFGVPILAPPVMARFAQRLGPGSAVRTNTGVAMALPQDYADMLGWPAQTDAVARVARTLSADERARLVIAAGNYGEAGALDFYGPRSAPRQSLQQMWPRLAGRN